MPGTRRSVLRTLPFIVLAALAARPALGDRPADGLLRLVPADSGLTLVVEDLNGTARRVGASPLAGELRRTGLARAWLASDAVAGLRQSLDEVRRVLEVGPTEALGKLAGEAVVLSLHAPPGAGPEAARGLVLSRVSDPTLLHRLNARLEAAWRDGGDLVRVEDRSHAGASYRARIFRPGVRPDDYTASFGERLFAWSNSEALIRGVLDRHAAGPTAAGLGDSPGFRAVRDRLPADPMASLFVDPRFAERLLRSQAEPLTPDESRWRATLARALGPVRYAGAALEWRDGPMLRVEEVADPSALAPALRRWAANSDGPAPAMRRIPPSALLIATGRVAPDALFDLAVGAVGDRDQPRLRAIILAVRGLLLGLDPRAEVVPNLGPGVLGYVEAPEAGDPGEPTRLPKVLALGVVGGPAGERAARGVENLLRTVLAVYALEERHGGGLRLETRAVAGGQVTTLTPEGPFAFAFVPGRFILATSPAAVARALAAGDDPRGGERLDRLRRAVAPEARFVVLADVRAARRAADGFRGEIVKRLAARRWLPISEADRQVGQVLEFADLFEAAFLSASAEPDGSAFHQSLGLVRLPDPRP